ncbi:Sodium channel and clathrin linker 1, partial [Stegodyphus mimosarum]
MAYREEQYVKEIEQLKLSIDLEIEKVSRRYKSEIKETEKQASAKIHDLMEEIQSLHRENSEKQGMFERAVRERQALESKLEQLYSESASGVPVSGSVFDDICKRLTMAERARDEFELKAAFLETALQELRSAKEEELQYLQGEQNNFKERLDNLLKDFNQASGDRIKLCDEVTKLKKKCMELEKELRVTKSKHANELSSLEESYRQKQQSYTEQLRVTEEHYQKICGELQVLLEAELKINNRWKEEVDDLIGKSEIKIKELCQNVIHLINQNSELVNILQQNNIYVPISNIYSLGDLVNVSQAAGNTS